MLQNNFHESAGIVHTVPHNAPSFDATLQSAWGCAASRTVSNCYSYALDIPDHGLGSPGWLALNDNQKWLVPHANSESSLHAGLVKDGLEPLEGIPDDTSNDHIIAAFFKEDQSSDDGCDTSDWHFYRRDSNGHWSHKLGSKHIPQQLNGALPHEDALKRGYKFVGFYKVPRAGIQYFQNYYWNPDSLEL